MLTGSAAGVLVASLASMPAACRGKIYPGTTINGIDVSGGTGDVARTQLLDAFSDFERHAITFRFGSQTWSYGLADLGFAIEYDEMIDRALDNGRADGLITRYESLLMGTDALDVPFMLKGNDEQLTAVLGDIASSIDTAPRNAFLRVEEGVVTIVDDEMGTQLDIESAVAATSIAVQQGRQSLVDLTVNDVSPDLSAAELANAKDSAVRLASEPIVFTFEGLDYPIDAPTLQQSLRVVSEREVRIDVSQLAPRLDAIAAAIYRAPYNVMLGWDSGLYVVSDHIDGVEVDRASLEQSLLALAESSDRSAELPVTPVKAEARSDNFEELGIDDYLSTGSSSFAGSSVSRAENVRAAARNISFHLVEPGGTFSFNDLLGAISVENGFVEGTVIDGDFAATDIGGGVCQVSTTVFRAAARAGFQFEEWHPHTWRLAFYEADGSPPGFDGAIYQPNFDWEYAMDLRFTNPLDSWLLLQVLIDGETVAAHFYGRSNGWNVTFGEAQLSEPSPVPEPVERVNERRAPGERVQVQYAQTGVTVQLPRTVTAADGSIISDGFFVSEYQAIPDVWEVGPSN